MHYRNLLMRIFVLGCMMLALSGCAGAATPDFQTMLQNLSQSYPAVWRLVTAAAYVAGFMMAFKAVYTLKAYGEARTLSATNISFKAPATYFIVAAALIYTPTAFQTLLLTSFGTPDITPLNYASNVKGWTHASTLAVLGLVQVIGVIAFIRGWFYMARTAEGGQQQNSFGKGLTHIVGGVLAINIVGTRDIIWNTFGFGT